MSTIYYNEDHLGDASESEAKRFIEQLNEEKKNFPELAEIEFAYSHTIFCVAQYLADGLNDIIDECWQDTLAKF